MDNALVLIETNQEFRDGLSAILKGYNIIFNEGTNTDSIEAGTAADITIIFGNPSKAFLASCPRLKWLQLFSAGANNYVNGEVPETVLLSCATGTFGHAISESMVAYTFDLFKKLYLYRDQQFAEKWERLPGNVKSVQDAVVLVIGLGDIGGEYARRMKALGAYVIGVRRSVQAKPDYVDELFLTDKMEEPLPRADIVALALPGTKDTVNIIGKAQLAKMKKDAFLINVGRGISVDTEALCDALESGALAGAALDVTEPEPLPPGHRLWQLKNAIITPHITGGGSMVETVQYRNEHFLANARRFVQGEALKSQVDYKTGYRIYRE